MAVSHFIWTQTSTMYIQDTCELAGCWAHAIMMPLMPQNRTGGAFQWCVEDLTRSRIGDEVFEQEIRRTNGVSQSNEAKEIFHESRAAIVSTLHAMKKLYWCINLLLQNPLAPF